MASTHYNRKEFMKSFLITILSICGIMISTVTAQTSTVRSSELQRITNDASYEFCNLKMYKDEAAWRGKTVAFSGIIQKTPVIAKGKGEYLQISGQTANGVVNVVVYLDTPIPTVDNYGNPVPTVTPGMDVRVYIQLKNCANFTSETGYLMNLPTGDGLFIFSKDDYSMTNPIWASKMLMR